MDEVAESMANWSAFRKGIPLLSQIHDINRFQFKVRLPMAGIWPNEEVRYRVAQLVYDEILEILRVSGLYRYDQLSVLSSEDQILVRYTDDRYAFEVTLTGEDMVISRQGSAFERFHRWYVELAPHFGGLVAKVADSIEEAIRSVTGLERHMSVQDASFAFRFIIFDVVSESGQAMLNAQVLESLIPRCPGPQGALSETEVETKSIARVDASFQKWQEEHGRPWIEIYTVEAPSNRDWSSVWVTFSMVGTSFERPSDGVRVDFDSEAFVSDYVTPLVGFLRQRGFGGFLQGLLSGKTFSTTASLLP